MGKKKNAPVVIVRKDKRLHKGAHLAAFMLTGGASGAVTAAKAGTNATYNARTRQLAAEADEPSPARAPSLSPSQRREQLKQAFPTGQKVRFTDRAHRGVLGEVRDVDAGGWIAVRVMSGKKGGEMPPGWPDVIAARPSQLVRV
jgi:hypothetical protein